MAKKKPIKPDEVTEDISNAPVPEEEELGPPGPVEAKKKSVATASTPSVKVVKSQVAARSWPPRALWIVVGLVGLIAVAALGYLLTRPPHPSVVSNTPSNNTNSALLVPRRLDGIMVPPAAANTNIIAAMMENASDSRPPSSLDKASVVYEALAEGGITRFLALFPFGQNIAEIGPIRSARLYYVQWAEEYKPLYVHAGGSPQALTYLRNSQTNVIDFNQFSHGPNFWRDKTRLAPHNLYTSTDLLFLGIKRIAPDSVPTYSSWLFKDETPLDNRPASVNDMVIDFSSFNYKVMYKYDRVNNQYNRFQGDKPHLTKDNSQVTVKNVVVEFAKTLALGDDKKRLDIEAVGQGKILMFRDGTVTQGTWKKTVPSARTEWLDADGQPLALNAGTIWVEVVPTDRQIVY